MTAPGYVTQFDAVDAVVAQVLDSTTRPTQLIMLSDHNARPLVPRELHEHVVFMRWKSWSLHGRFVAGPANAAELVAGMSMHPERP